MYLVPTYTIQNDPIKREKRLKWMTTASVGNVDWVCDGGAVLREAGAVGCIFIW